MRRGDSPAWGPPGSWKTSFLEKGPAAPNHFWGMWGCPPAKSGMLRSSSWCKKGMTQGVGNELNLGSFRKGNPWGWFMGSFPHSLLRKPPQKKSHEKASKKAPVAGANIRTGRVRLPQELFNNANAASAISPLHTAGTFRSHPRVPMV